MTDVNVKNNLISRVAKTLIYVFNNPNKHIKKISFDLEIDYNYVSKIVTRCEEHGLMTAEMASKERRVYLTDKGKKVSKLLQQIDDLMD